MNTMILRARGMSLALLVVAVIDHGYGQLQADYSGASPHSSGLKRLGRDLMRRAGREITEPAASDSTSSRNRQSRATLAFGRALSTSKSNTGYQDAVTPPWTTTLGFLVCGVTMAVIAASWWTFGAYGGCLAAFISIVSVVGFRRIIPAEDSFHYKKLNVLSMADRYVGCVRDNDKRRAATLKELLDNIGRLVEYEAPSDREAQRRSATRHRSY